MERWGDLGVVCGWYLAQALGANAGRPMGFAPGEEAYFERRLVRCGEDHRAGCERTTASAATDEKYPHLTPLAMMSERSYV